jgi:hypothetical protein
LNPSPDAAGPFCDQPGQPLLKKQIEPNLPVRLFVGQNRISFPDPIDGSGMLRPGIPCPQRYAADLVRMNVIL